MSLSGNRSKLGASDPMGILFENDSVVCLCILCVAQRFAWAFWLAQHADDHIASTMVLHIPALSDFCFVFKHQACSMVRVTDANNGVILGASTSEVNWAQMLTDGRFVSFVFRSA